VGKVFRRNNTEEQIAEPNVPPATRNPNEIEIPGDPITIRPEGVPEDWIKERSNKNDGYKYIDPKSKRSTDVRVQKGNPESTNPSQQKDYVKWKKDGNIVPGDSPAAHIPLDEFKFDKELFK
ncbi:MAG: hypothetical protein AAF195_03365, partial [Pseudomonadota bacterium]